MDSESSISEDPDSASYVSGGKVSLSNTVENKKVELDDDSDSVGKDGRQLLSPDVYGEKN